MKGGEMATATVTKSTGGKTMPMGMTVVSPDCQMTGDELSTFADEAKVNSIFFANLLSSFAAHERCGLHLYRSVARMTQIEAWRVKYEEFGKETENHIEILSDLIEEMGGDSMYVSPSARMTEFMDTKLMEPILLAGSVDQITQELTCLEAVLLAESKCHSNWELLKALVEKLPDSSPREAIQKAIEQVGDQEDEHIRWARTTWEQTLLGQII
jgi:rubrerythrin